MKKVEIMLFILSMSEIIKGFTYSTLGNWNILKFKRRGSITINENRGYIVTVQVSQWGKRFTCTLDCGIEKNALVISEKLEKVI